MSASSDTPKETDDMAYEYTGEALTIIPNPTMRAAVLAAAGEAEAYEELRRLAGVTASVPNE